MEDTTSATTRDYIIISLLFLVSWLKSVTAISSCTIIQICVTTFILWKISLFTFGAISQKNESNFCTPYAKNKECCILFSNFTMLSGLWIKTTKHSTCRKWKGKYSGNGFEGKKRKYDIFTWPEVDPYLIDIANSDRWEVDVCKGGCSSINSGDHCGLSELWCLLKYETEGHHHWRQNHDGPHASPAWPVRRVDILPTM